jgi:hypothetical protein
LGPVFMFCAPGFVFGGTEGVVSHFHILRARTHFWRYRGRRSHFHVLCSRTRFRRYRGRRVMFCAHGIVFNGTEVDWSFLIFCVPGLIFGGTEGVGSCLHVLSSGTRFRRCRVRRVSFSCFSLLDSFSVVPGATGPFLLFSAPGLVFGGIEGVGSHFHALLFRNRFRWGQVRRVPF